MRNSTSKVTDKSNNAKAVYTYSDYGETEVVGDSSFSNEVCYTGGIYDAETGEYYLNARYYNPDISRFSTMDTYRGEFEEPLSLNLYNYCSGNPINYVDPSGHHAVFMLAKKAVYTLGHIGMTAAAKKNTWHYLSYNDNYKKTTTTNWASVSSLKKINEKYRKGLSDYTSGIKFFGKFKKTINVFYTEAAKPYDKYKHNCSQVACKAMQYGPFKAKRGKKKYK